MLIENGTPTVLIKGWKHKGKILLESISAYGFESNNVLKCLYPNDFVNVEELPDGFGVW